jgi:hypothetical protein
MHEYDDWLCENAQCDIDHSEIELGTTIKKSGDKDNSVYLIPPAYHIALSYTNNGDTLYCNFNHEIEAAKIDKKLRDNGIGTSGSFVFDIESKPIQFNQIMSNFVLQLTQMNNCFCVAFDVTTMYSCTYYPNSKALVFTFGTSHG